MTWDREVYFTFTHSRTGGSPPTGRIEAGGACLRNYKGIMKKGRAKCEACEFRGYSSYFCRMHLSKVTQEDCKDCGSYRSLRQVGRTAAFGAGVGAAVTVVGIGVVPVMGLKAAIGHAVVAKLTAGGGMAGAGVNVFRKARKGQSKFRQKKKKRILLPLYLKKKI